MNRSDLYYADPAQPLMTAGEELDYLLIDMNLSRVAPRACSMSDRRLHVHTMIKTGMYSTWGPKGSNVVLAWLVRLPYIMSMICLYTCFNCNILFLLDCFRRPHISTVCDSGGGREAHPLLHSRFRSRFDCDEVYQALFKEVLRAPTNVVQWCKNWQK